MWPEWWLDGSRCTRRSSLQLEEELEHEVWDSLGSLSLESDTANHNTWNDLLNFVTHYDFGNRFQANLEDEEPGRFSCHYALDWLCLELHTFCHPRCTLQPLLNDALYPCIGSLLGVQAWSILERCSAANGNSICYETQRIVFVFSEN